MLPVPLKKIFPPLALAFARKAGNGSRDLYLRESDFLAEEPFREVLSFERKRSERSKKPVFVLLLDVAAVEDRRARFKAVHSIPQIVTGLAPEAPLLGWYKQDKAIGVIFTETNGIGNDLPERIAAALQKTVAERHARAIRYVSCSFPETGPEPTARGDASPFYADLVKKEKNRQAALFFKRALDIAGGTAGLLLFSPLFVALPLLIKATSKGPVLFRQERIGRYGKTFVFLKFRSMSVNNDARIHREYIRKFITEQKRYENPAGEASVYKIKDDPRVTPLGRFLRKTSLDELPQFLNVLKGEMSLVGPRPPIPYELENYDLWHRRRVMEIKPGITGLWQVQGRSSTTFDEMVRLDLKYAKEWSLWLDIKIILKTPWVVLTGKGGY